MRKPTASAITSGGSAMCESFNRIIQTGNSATGYTKFSKEFSPRSADQQRSQVIGMYILHAPGSVLPFRERGEGEGLFRQVTRVLLNPSPQSSPLIQGERRERLCRVFGDLANVLSYKTDDQRTRVLRDDWVTETRLKQSGARIHRTPKHCVRNS